MSLANDAYKNIYIRNTTSSAPVARKEMKLLDLIAQRNDTLFKAIKNIQGSC